jgi:threonine dehydratase
MPNNNHHDRDHHSSSADDKLTLAEIEQARERISPFMARTPLVRSRTLSEQLGTNIYLKLEVFQKTGSFKVRGAFNKILNLPERTRQGGVIAVSAGNHAQAVAFAARSLAAPALIIMPQATPRTYVEATRSFGADILFVPTWKDGFARIPNYELQGWTPIHPFDDPVVIAGQGSLGLELIEDLPEITDVVASIGGGGLVGGIGVALKTLKPNVRIWGVETEGTASMSQALAAGRVVELSQVGSVARTLAVQAVSELTLRLAERYLESVTVVSDREAITAMGFLLERAKVLTEPAASCTLSAAARLCGQFSPASHVVLVLCGGNVGLEDLCRFTLDSAGAIGESASTAQHEAAPISEHSLLPEKGSLAAPSPDLIPALRNLHQGQ